MTRTPRSALRALASLAAVALAASVALTGASSAQGAAQTTAVTTPTPSSGTDAPASTANIGTTAWTPTSSLNAVKYNSLYRSGRLASPNCAEPRYPLNSANNILAWHRSLEYCLSKTWYWKLRAAGKSFSRPTVVVYSRTLNTRCGTIYPTRSQPMYCSATKGIYIPAPRYINWYKQNTLWTRAYALHVMGHEYGHHVQALSGILSASWYRQYYVHKTTAAKLEESRRRELQASCLSGMFVGADRASYPLSGSLAKQWAWIIAHTGDEYGTVRDHGKASNHYWWTRRGYDYMNAYYCNAWVASSSIVA